MQEIDTDGKENPIATTVEKTTRRVRGEGGEGGESDGDGDGGGETK